jgi:hypothetical protein
MKARASIECLSNADLKHGKVFSGPFLEMGITDFHGACRWLQSGIPYGSNSEKHSLQTLFRDRCGTCTTKHGVAAALAAELGLRVSKYIVFYRLDGSIRPGAEEILTQAGLEFVPASHCVLMEKSLLVDLTWGNQTGKLKDLEEFELYFKTACLPNVETMQHLTRLAHSWYRLQFPELASRSDEEIATLRTACSKLKAIRCEC